MEPSIRIKGSQADWQSSLLGELFRERVESNPLAEMLSVTMNNGVIRAADNGRFDNSNSDKSKYRLVKVGDIAYNSMRMWQGASGCSEYEGIVSPAYTVVTPNGDIDPHFFAILFKSPNVINLFKLNSQGLTSDTWNLKYPAFSKLSVYYPVSIEEQHLIKHFFKSLDKLIQATSNRISTLRQMKEASLQTMFPKEGETKPALRFKGFDNEWVKKPLNTYLTPSKVKNTDGKYSREDVLSVSGEYGVVNQIAFQGRSFAGASILNYGVVEQKNVVYTKSPLKTNPYGIIKTNEGPAGIVSTLYAVYQCTDDVNPTFIQYYFDLDSRLNSYLRPLVRKGAKNDMKVSSEGALLGDVIFPSYDEQTQIANYFMTFDKQITLEEQKLESLKRIKSACLDKMFV